MFLIFDFMNASYCIITDRLILRPFVKGDEEDVLELMKDDYTARKAGFKPFKSVEEAERFINTWRYEGYAVTEAVEAVKAHIFNTTCLNEIELYVYCGNEASRNVALKCGFFPDYSRYKENVRSEYGTIESEERFTITRGDFEWEQMGCSTFSSAA